MESIQPILDEAERAIAQAASLAELQAVETHYLGRKGVVGQLLRQLGALPPEQRPQFGQQVNAAREQLERLFAERRAALEQRNSPSASKPSDWTSRCPARPCAPHACTR